MKYPVIHLKITMKSAEYLMKNRNEMHWVCNERYHVSIEKSPLRWPDRLMKCLLRISHFMRNPNERA